MKIMLNESRRYNSEMEIKNCNKKIQSLQEKISTMKNYSELDWSKQIKESEEKIEELKNIIKIKKAGVKDPLNADFTKLNK